MISPESIASLAVRARQGVNPKKEILLRVLTHHLMLLAAAEDFDRAS